MSAIPIAEISVPGRCTLAVTPGRSVRAAVVRSRTVASWRRASRPTTKRPIRLAVSEVTSPPSARRSFAAVKSSLDMPSPRSATSTSRPASTARPTVTITGDSGGEYRSALSRSSAIRWPISPAAEPADRDVGHVADLHPAILLDLGHRGAQHVGQGNRGRHAVAFHGVGENQQVVAVAAHARRQVIEPEEVIEPDGIFLVELEGLDECQLLLDQ